MCFILINAWSRLRRTNRCTYQWGEHISTPDISKQLHFMVFGFWLKRIPIHQLTRNLCFKHSFPPLNSWSRLRRTNQYTYHWGEHIRTPDIGKQLHFMVFGYLFLAETDTNPPTNSKSMFQHSILLLHSSSRFRRTNRWVLFAKVFSVKIEGMASVGKREQSTKFSQRKSYFSPIRKSFFPWHFPTIWYI